MSDVEANLKKLIARKRRQLGSANDEIRQASMRRDSLHNQIIELEGLLDQGDSGAKYDAEAQHKAMASMDPYPLIVSPAQADDADALDTSADRFRA